MLEELRNYINRLYRSADYKAYSSLYERKKGILLSFFLYFFLLISLFFVIAALVTGDYLFLPADGSFLILAIVMLYFHKVKNYLQKVAITFITLICLISTLFIQSGGMNNTGIATAVLVPIPIILLLGKNKGMWTLIGFAVVNVSGLIFFENKNWSPNYDPDWLERLSIVFIILSLIAYVNEFVFDQLYLRLETMANSFRTSQERYKNLAINKEKFLSLISHDLSHHIGNFAVTSTMLHEQFEVIPDDEKKKLIAQLSSLSNQNYHLLHDLLRWSTVQNETIPYTPKPLKIESVFREVIELFEASINEKKLSLFLKVKSNSEVYADNDMIGSIVRNLLSNAIKFSEVNGEIRISATEKGEFMLISISDKGIGLTFEELQQVKASISFSKPGTKDEPGTGIGLILVREFIQKNRGEFFIESQPDKGTEVSFTLPLVE